MKLWTKFRAWCGSNTAVGRCTRTIFQGIVGVLIANVDFIIGTQFDPQTKAIITALTMAVLSPIQKALGTPASEAE